MEEAILECSSSMSLLPKQPGFADNGRVGYLPLTDTTPKGGSGVSLYGGHAANQGE
jgi:hypothetical protein